MSQVLWWVARFTLDRLWSNNEKIVYDYYLAGPFSTCALLIADIDGVARCEPRQFFSQGGPSSGTQTQAMLVTQMTVNSAQTLADQGAVLLRIIESYPLHSFIFSCLMLACGSPQLHRSKFRRRRWKNFCSALCGMDTGWQRG